MNPKYIFTICIYVSIVFSSCSEKRSKMSSVSDLDQLTGNAQIENTSEAWNKLAAYLYEEGETEQNLFEESTRKAYALSCNDNDSIEIARSLLFLAEIDFNQNEFDLSIEKNQKALLYIRDKNENQLKSMIFHHIGLTYGISGEFNLAIDYYKKSLVQKQKFPEGISKSAIDFNNIAVNFFHLAMIDSAFFYTKEAERIALHTNDSIQVIEAYGILAVLHKRKGEYYKALKYNEKTLSLYESLGLYKDMSNVWLNIATLYYDLEKKEDALYYSRKAVQNSFKYPYGKNETGIALNNHGQILVANHRYSEGKDTLLLASSYIENIPYQAYINFIGLSTCLLSENNLLLAEQYLIKADSILKKNKELPVYRYNKTKGKLAYAKGKYDDAILFLEKYIQNIEQYKMIKSSDDFIIYSILSDIYEKERKDYKKALYYKSIANSLQEIVHNEKHTKAMGEFYVKYQTAEKDAHISQLQLEKEKENQTRIIIISISLFIVVLLVIFVLYNRIKRLKQEKEASNLSARIKEKDMEFQSAMTQAELNSMQSYLSGLETERERLAKELHDNVANELLSIDFQLKEIVQVPEKTSLQLTNLHDEIRNISHELMPPLFKYASLAETIYDYVSSISKKDIDIDVVIQNEEVLNKISEKFALEIYRIIQEAVSNIIKHSEAKIAKITLQSDEKRLTLIIEDNGIGFDSSQKNQGIGLNIIKDRAKSLNGEMEIKADLGCKITINIPL